VYNGNLRQRIALMGGVLIVTPLLILSVAGWIVFERLSRTLKVSAARTSTAHLVELTRSLVDICRSSQQANIEALKSGRSVVDAAGAIGSKLGKRQEWRAKNEATGEISELWLPILSAGDAQFLPVTGFSDPAPLVDDIQRIYGTPATIFQRMDDSGDMLRISSSVKSQTGTRAIGTYIPISPASQAAQAVAAVLSGRSQIAKAIFNRTTYLTLYQPLKDQTGKVVGMLSTALAEEQIAARIRSLAIHYSNIDRVGLFAWRASGADQGKALIMADESLQGRNLWNRTDSSGTLYVRQICARALAMPAGEIAESKYQTPPRVGALPQSIVATFAYVPALDWVVGYAQPEADFLAGATALQTILNGGMWLLLGLGLAGTGLAVQIWIKFSGGLAHKLAGLLTNLTENAQQVSVAAAELSAEAKRAAAQKGADQILGQAALTAREISLAIRHINASSHSVSSVMEAIDQIAFATNMLAVNSALEASQADGANQPIAGIAEELRILAERCREAARETQSELQQSRMELERSTAQSDEAAADLQRQAENLVRLAEGLDQTVQRVSAYLELNR
jgi:hypothetical protein